MDKINHATHNLSLPAITLGLAVKKAATQWDCVCPKIPHRCGEETLFVKTQHHRRRHKGLPAPAVFPMNGIARTILLTRDFAGGTASFFSTGIKNTHMSQAFVRKGDDQSLDEVSPTLQGLIFFLTRENNGIRVYEKRTHLVNGREIHDMSNGLSYTKDANGRWKVV